MLIRGRELRAHGRALLNAHTQPPPVWEGVVFMEKHQNRPAAFRLPAIDLPATGRNIERLRRARGLSVRDLQTAFGFSTPQAIYKWQHGRALPTLDNMSVLARLLGVSIEAIIVYEDQAGPR